MKKVLLGIGYALVVCISLSAVGLGFFFVVMALGDSTDKMGNPIYWLYLAIEIVIAGAILYPIFNTDSVIPKDYTCNRCNRKFTSDDESKHIIKDSGDNIDLCSKCMDKFIK